MAYDPDEKELREIISPEGVEERVIREAIFRVTMTGGGKFRGYVIQDGKVIPREVYDTKEKAFENIGGDMILMGGLLSNLKRTVEILMQAMKKDGKR